VTLPVFFINSRRDDSLAPEGFDDAFIVFIFLTLKIVRLWDLTQLSGQTFMLGKGFVATTFSFAHESRSFYDLSS
jgi:hypothetical protein